MRFTALIVIAVLALAFGAVNGVLMCVSPKHHAAFWRWYTRFGSQVSGGEFGGQIETRIVGLVISLVSIFLGWKLTEKILSGNASDGIQGDQGAWKGFIFATTRNGSWFSILAGGLAIIYGVYSLLRTSSVASRLERRGVLHSPATAASLRQIKILGALFILAGAFFVFVATRNH